MLDFHKRMMMVALRDRLVQETGTNVSATVIVMHAFGLQSIDEASVEMDRIKHSLIVDGNMVTRLNNDTYLLETGDRSLVIDEEFLSTCTSDRIKVLKRAMVQLNLVH